MDSLAGQHLNKMFYGEMLSCRLVRLLLFLRWHALAVSSFRSFAQPFARKTRVSQLFAYQKLYQLNTFIFHLDA